LTLSTRELTADQIEAMSYNELIGLVRETNRPPGGLRSIVKIAQQAFLRPGRRVLEIGTSTGITAVELAGFTGCEVVAIDINEASLEDGRRRAEIAGVAGVVSFELRDATRTELEDESFDLVFCGNVTSLVSDREAALAEYTRVLRTGGFIGAIPMYYTRPPSDELLEAVSQAIHVQIEAHDRQFWLDFFVAGQLHPHWVEDFEFDSIASDDVDAFVDEILGREHLLGLSDDARSALARRYGHDMQLFRENLSHMGFSVLLARKEPAGTERELFTATVVSPK
jgi:SAM-dependent methyltransferase